MIVPHCLSLPFSTSDAGLAAGGPADLSLASADTGFLLKTAARFGQSDLSRLHGAEIYTVQKDETLSQIAQAFGLKMETIVWANSLLNQSVLAGQNLIIPPVNGVIHTVASGETVKTLAVKYRVPADKIMTQNKLSEDTSLAVGTQLIVPGAIKKVIASPRTGIVNQGSSSYASAIGKLIKPAQGRYTQYFRRGHYAVDIANRNGGTIYAARSGTVVEARPSGWNSGYGHMVIIDHGDELKTLYAHLSTLSVSKGQQVAAGQVIGAMGSTGRSSGTHLHFEVVYKGYKKNPVAYF